MDDVRTHISDYVAVISVSNPPHGYMTHDLAGKLHQGFRSAERNDLVRVIIITGADPDVFIQHYNLAELSALSKKLNARAVRYNDRDHTPERDMDLLFRRIENSSKPVIAAINGNAMGFGCELALACDFRVMQAGPYLIGQPEIRVGLIPGAGGTQRLTRVVGMARAMDLVLHGRKLSPNEALAQGLVHEVCGGAVRAAALQRAHELTQLSPTALSHAKKLVHKAAAGELYAGLDAERSLFVDTLASPEALSLLDHAVRDGNDFRTL
jgi:enoyl-CoA hydratase